jgi:hypothetical protein
MAEKSQRRFHTKYKQKCIKKRGCGCQLTVRQKTHIFPNNSTSKFAVVISPRHAEGHEEFFCFEYFILIVYSKYAYLYDFHALSAWPKFNLDITYACIQVLVYGKKFMHYGHILNHVCVKSCKKKVRLGNMPPVFFFYHIKILIRWASYEINWIIQ